MASGKGSGLRTDSWRKDKNDRLCGEGKTVRRKMNGVREGSGPRTDPQRKDKREGVWDGEIPQGCEN